MDRLPILCYSLLVVVTVVTGARFRNDEDYDILSDVGTSVRCSKSKLSVSKADALYTWEVDGFLGYLRYLRDFGSKEFQHSTTNIVYDSEKINGEWTFEISSNGQETLVTATYAYQETKDNLNGNFGIKLKIFQPKFESITLPIQKPTDITREKIFSNVNSKGTSGKDKGSSYIFSYTSSEEETPMQEGVDTVTLKFQWPPIPTEKFLQFHYEQSDLIFAFMIHAYFPTDPKTFRKSTCNLDNLESKYVYSESRDLIFDDVHHCDNCKNNFLLQRNSTAMFTNSAFSDLIVRTENITVPVHSVILYHSSSILASAILNATDHTTENGTAVLEIEDDIGYKGTYEMLRYIYTGKVENISEFAHKIIVAAQRYDLPDLKAQCEESLISNANLTNVINLYVLGIDVSSPRLIRKAFAVIQTNRASIVSQSDEFRKLSVKYPNLMFELFVT